MWTLPGSRDQVCVHCTGRWIFIHCTTREVLRFPNWNPFSEPEHQRQKEILVPCEKESCVCVQLKPPLVLLSGTIAVLLIDTHLVEENTQSLQYGKRAFLLELNSEVNLGSIAIQ